MTFHSPKVALYLYKSTIWPCMEYGFHVQAFAPRCYLELLDKLQKSIGLSVLHLPPLLNHWFIVEMQSAEVFSIGITLVDVHLNWLNWFHFLFLKGGLLGILVDFMIFLSPFPDVTRMAMLKQFFPRTAKLWNSLLIECFFVFCGLNGFRSRISRYLLTVGSF